MKYQTVPVTPFVQNCSLIWCEQTGQTGIVDPGGDPEVIINAISNRELTPVAVLLTHGHIDHAGAAADIAEQYQIPIIGPHRGDEFLLNAFEKQCQMFGFPPVNTFTPSRWLDDGDTVGIGNITLEVLHCPGHTPGHVVFVDKQHNTAWVGDVLFHGSIGRSDFPGGDQAALLSSIKDKLWPLGSDIRFIPGHGPSSTFAEERRSNPFVCDR